MKEITVLNLIKMAGIGGVQSLHCDFLKCAYADTHSEFVHETLSISQIDSQYLSRLKGPFFSGIKALLRFLVSKSDHVILHAHNTVTASRVAYLWRVYRPKHLVLHERGNAWNLPKCQAHIVENNISQADLVLCNSNATKQMLIQKFGVESSCLHVLKNGLVAYSGESQKNNLHAQNRVLFVGRLESNKGVHVLIRALAKLRDKGITLDIVGTGSLHTHLLSLKAQLGASNVNFLGRVSEARCLFKDYDLLVIPSIREPLGNVAIEAAFTKTPVLAAAVDGLPEVVIDGVTGFTLEPTKPVEQAFYRGKVPIPEWVYYPSEKQIGAPKELDPDMLAEKILEVLNYDHLEAIAEQAYQYAMEHFTIEKYHQNLHQLYRSLSG